MSEEFLVGQSVITDSLLHAGYQMTAVSKSVSAEDRLRLLAVPQVSDELHFMERPGDYLSFHPLPSGAWALSHRFVQGKRLAGGNRVVVHTLVIPGDLLNAALGDAWLLVAGCRYRDASGTLRLLSELAEVVGGFEIREVEDLVGIPPEDPWLFRQRNLGGRCRFLLSRWGSGALRVALGQILGAVEAGYGVLLPQDQVMEQLMLLAWSALPLQDRLQVPWTTYLSIGGGEEIFRLALTPSPEVFRQQQTLGSNWILMGELPGSDEGGGEAMAEVLVTNPDRFPEIDQGLMDQRLSLRRPREVSSLVDWVLNGRPLPSEGFADAGPLEQFLARFHLRGGQCLQRLAISREVLLGAVALTVVRQHRSGAEWDRAVQEVLATLTEWDLRSALLGPPFVGQMVRDAASRHEAEAALGAVALFLASPEWRVERFSRKTLLQSLNNPVSEDKGGLVGRAGLETTTVFVRLAENAVRLPPEEAEMAYRVVYQNGDIIKALDGLTARREHLVPLRAILGVAESMEDHLLAGKVASGSLVPLLAAEPAAAREERLGQRVLEALRPMPEALGWALGRWEDGRLYDEALGALRRWTEEGLPDAHRAAVYLASLAYAGRPQILRERSSVVGLAQTLARAGVFPEHWLAFAFAEAAFLDSGQKKEEFQAFQQFLKDVRIPPDKGKLDLALEALLVRFREDRLRRVFGRAYRALVVALGEPVGRRPEIAAGILMLLPELAAQDLPEWADAVLAVTAVVAQKNRREASQLAGCWWSSLLRLPQFEDLAPGAIRLLDFLDRRDAETVVGEWTMRSVPAEGAAWVRELYAALERLARRYGLKEQELLCRAGRLAWNVQHSGRSRAAAVEELVRRAARLHLDEPQMVRAIARLLPAKPVDSARAVLRLLLDPQLAPATRSMLENRFLESALDLPPQDLPEALPPVEEMAVDNNLLLVVSKKMGQIWPQVSKPAEAYARRLLALQREDALDALLDGAESEGRLPHIEDFDLYLQFSRRKLSRLARD